MSRYVLFNLLALSAIVAFACSSTAPTVPANSINLSSQTAYSSDRVIWGVFDMALDAEAGTAQIRWNREVEAHFNVTAWVQPPNCYDCVKVTDSSYNPATSRFYVQVAFKNPTNKTGYDVRGVISDPGGSKFLVNPDGVTSVWGSPMQFKAINVNPGRAFGPYQVHGRMFEFYFPPGEKFANLKYIIDASLPGNVTEPCVENGYSDPVVNNNFSTTFIRCWVWDHQNDLATVVADLMPLGGSPMTPMYDDGLHSDGAAGDKVFGIKDIKTGVPVGIYMINIYPMDSKGNMGWGQVAVTVQKTTGGDNQPPIIQSVTSDRTTANGGANEKIKITVTAVDPNGDPISYQFQGSGTFSGQTDNFVYWKPSSTSTGPQNITCKVLDTKGGEDTEIIKLWSTNLSIVQGGTNQGKIPSGSLPCAKPDTTISMADDFKGKVVYCNYWATWCGYCIQEMPDLTNVYNKYKSNTDYVHIYINLQESKTTVLNFINSNPYLGSYWALDTSGSYFAKFRLFNNNSTGIPQHALFDRDGNCRWSKLGKIPNTTELENAINQLL